MPWWRMFLLTMACVSFYLVGADVPILFDELAAMPRRPLPFSILATFTAMHGCLMAWCGLLNWRNFRGEGRR